jgi:hypothetical protein
MTQMRARQRLLALLLAGAGSVALVACSSTDTPSASNTTPAATSAPTTAATTTPPADPTKASAADCVILKPIAANAITKLTSLQGLSQAQASTTLAAYVSELQQALAKLTSPVGKNALTTYLTALGKLATEDQATATADITAALGTLSSACP